MLIFIRETSTGWYAPFFIQSERASDGNPITIEPYKMIWTYKKQLRKLSLHSCHILYRFL